MSSLRAKDFTLRFDEDEVTAVCEGPSPGVLCFGTESGKVVFHDLQAGTRKELEVMSDAINGVAVWRDLIGVSTRSEVSFYRQVLSDKEVEFVTGVPRGAHGILVTPNGHFVAPMATDGILCYDPTKERGRDLWADHPSHGDLNLYKLIHLGDPEGKELMASAARTDGLLTIGFDASHTQNQIMGWTSRDLDIVDVCALRSAEFPLAFAGLGLDRSLVFVRDPLVDEKPRRLLLQGIRGTPYAIQKAHDSLFLLTSNELIMFPNASAYLKNEKPDSSLPFYSVTLHASDIQVIHNNWLAIFLDEKVLFAPLPDTQESGGPDFDSMAWHEEAGNPIPIKSPWERCVDTTPWVHRVA